MVKSNFLIVLCGVLLLFFPSCERNDQQYTEIIQKQFPDCTPTNSDNPFEYIGEWHNTAVSQIISIYPIESMNKNEIYTLCGEYEYVDTSSSAPTYPTLNSIQFFNILYPVAENGTIPTNTYISTELTDTLNSLFSNLSQSCYETDSCDFYSRIKASESAIINGNTNLVENEMSLALCALSTLRHSYSFWMRQNTKTSSPNTYNLTFREVIRIIFADCFGSVIGTPITASIMAYEKIIEDKTPVGGDSAHNKTYIKNIQ